MAGILLPPAPVLKVLVIGRSLKDCVEKVTRAAWSRLSSKILMKFVTAPGRYLPPSVTSVQLTRGVVGFMDPERSNTSVMTTGLLLATAVSPTFSVFHWGSIPMKKVLSVTEAVFVKVRTPVAAFKVKWPTEFTTV